MTAFSSYAAIASASDALSSPATASDAVSMLFNDDEDYGSMPLSSVGTVTNTVDRTGITVSYRIHHSDGSYSVKRTYLSSDGYFSGSTDDGTIDNICFDFSSVSLPPPGKYKFSMDVSSDFSYDIVRTDLYSRFGLSNASVTTNAISLDSNLWTSFSGDYYLSPYTIDVGARTSSGVPFSVLLVLDSIGAGSNIGGSVRFCFSSYSGSDPGFEFAGSSDTDINTSYQQGITSGLSNIGDTLEEIVETISMQLDALWNQLYNYMHLPQMEKLEAIRQAIENIRLDVDVDNQDVVNKLDEQIRNDNNNTQRVEEAVEKHGNFIIEGLKSLFIPDEEYFSSLFDRLHQFFSDRLGFLYVPFDLLIRLLDAIKDADTAFAGIPFPGIQAGEWVLLEPTTVTFDILNEFPELVQALHFITSVVMIGAFLNLLHRKMEEVMSR